MNRYDADAIIDRWNALSRTGLEAGWEWVRGRELPTVWRGNVVVAQFDTFWEFEDYMAEVAA